MARQHRGFLTAHKLCSRQLSTGEVFSAPEPVVRDSQSGAVVDGGRFRRAEEEEALRETAGSPLGLRIPPMSADESDLQTRLIVYDPWSNQQKFIDRSSVEHLPAMR
jgi:hypothetical protein